ncbi:MAG: hypothetical protein ACLTSL_18770, partial [Odoribacter splanchnicus]
SSPARKNKRFCFSEQEKNSLTGGTPHCAKNFTLRFRQTPPVGRSEKARRPTEATGSPNTNTEDGQVTNRIILRL